VRRSIVKRRSVQVSTLDLGDGKCFAKRRELLSTTVRVVSL
jgi:hypothetical protein